MKKFFEELSRRLREGGVESSNVEDRRLEIFLHGQPVLFVSPGNDVFLFPAGSNNPEASELYHRVAQTADEVYTYVEEVQTAPTLHISGLSEKFHLLADFGGAVLAGRELENGRGYRTKDDSYSNLVLVTTDVHRLLHATKSETIKAYMDMIGPDKKQIAKINRLRKMLDLPDI